MTKYIVISRYYHDGAYGANIKVTNSDKPPIKMYRLKEDHNLFFDTFFSLKDAEDFIACDGDYDEYRKNKEETK